MHGCVSRWKITVVSFGNFRKHWSRNQDKVDTRQQFEFKRNSLPTPDAGILAMPDDFSENVKHRGICFGTITQKHRGSRPLLLAWKTTCFRPRKIREAINIHTRPWWTSRDYGKGTVVSFPPFFARTFSSRERETSGYEAGRIKRIEIRENVPRDKANCPNQASVR